MEYNYTFNECQSTLEELHFDSYPEEVKELFLDFLNNVPFIKFLVSKDRPHAKDLPRDKDGKVIFDVTKPPILDDMDYFRPAAIEYKKAGKYTNLRPNPNPNSEYGKWIREEIRRCYEGMVRPSDGMWITGDMYFMLNYFPMFITKIVGKSKKGERVIDFPEVWEGINMRLHYIYLAINGGMYNDNGGQNGCEISSRGKAHPYSQIVYTPNGKTTWGNIKIGDKLFSDDGKLTTVINVPFDEECDVYKITLKDGRIVYASGNHLWKVWRSYSHSFKTLSTLDMLKDFAKSRKISSRNPKGKEYIYRIPVNKGCQWQENPTLVDPYTFGLLLGDGCFRHKSCYFTQEDKDLEEEKKYIPYNLIKWENKYAYRIDIPNWLNILKGYGLYYLKSEDKFIPDEYKYNSKEVRTNLLKGLMDSDGTVDNNGIPIVGVSSKKLADDITFIARSLGYNCLCTTKKAGYKINGIYKRCLDSYNIRIFTNDLIFNLSRKQNLVSKFKSRYSRSNRDFSTIINIEFSHREKCKCVTVDNESECYLIGDFITTHNSKSYTMASMMSKRFVLGESFEVNRGVKCMATAYLKQYLTSDGILNKFQAGIDFLALNTQFPAKRLKSSLQDMAWKMGYIDLDTGTQKGTLNEVIGVSAKDDSSKVRGKRQNLIVVEEFGSFRNVLELYNILIPSVQEGDISFGTMYLIGCVCAGTKVWRANGSMCNIEDLDPKDGILGYTDTREISQENIDKWQPKVMKPCVRITFSDRTLECSTDHPILIQQAHHKRRTDNYNLRDTSYTPIFKRACNLKVGDSVCVADGVDVFGNATLFDARLVGMLIGDGCYCYDNTPTYSSEDTELLNYVKSKYKWSLSRQFTSKKGNLYQEIRVKGICANLREIGIYGQTKLAKRLPENYLYLNKQDAALLLAGLWDTDGCFCSGKSYCGFFTSSCIEMVKQIKVLLEKFGIFTTIKKQMPRIAKGRKDRNPWYILRIVDDKSFERFKENIPLLVPHKIKALNEIVSRTKGNGRYKARYYNGDYRVIKVKAIEFIGNQYVWNMQVDGTHTYIANGIITHNTAGDDESDFQGAQEIVYNPKGYRMYGLPNVYDKEGLGRKDITFFFPGYVNRKGCYDENGNSDVTKALLEILYNRYVVKHNSSDINSITKTIAEIPITPQEAILRTRGNLFPVTQLNERLNDLDGNPDSFNDVYIGLLVQRKDGEVEFKPTSDIPIRDFPLKDNKAKGAVEIFEMPLKDKNGKVFSNRYILGHDPVDDDAANTMSLTSTFVLDLFTDRIVAEYTGRQDYADDNFEIVRLLCLFYNGKCLYELNKKGIFAYFSQRNCVYLLADTPQYLKDQQIIKEVGYGNKAKGVLATAGVNNFANQLIKEWLIKPVPTIVKEDGEDKEITISNLFFIRNRALLKELILFNPDINVDRVRALGMVMLYRLEFMILYGGDINANKQEEAEASNLANDDFFTRNYDLRFGKSKFSKIYTS